MKKFKKLLACLLAVSCMAAVPSSSFVSAVTTQELNEIEKEFDSLGMIGYSVGGSSDDEEISSFLDKRYNGFGFYEKPEKMYVSKTTLVDDSWRMTHYVPDENNEDECIEVEYETVFTCCSPIGYYIRRPNIVHIQMPIAAFDRIAYGIEDGIDGSADEAVKYLFENIDEATLETINAAIEDGRVIFSVGQQGFSFYSYDDNNGLLNEEFAEKIRAVFEGTNLIRKASYSYSYLEPNYFAEVTHFTTLRYPSVFADEITEALKELGYDNAVVVVDKEATEIDYSEMCQVEFKDYWNITSYDILKIASKIYSRIGLLGKVDFDDCIINYPESPAYNPDILKKIEEYKNTPKLPEAKQLAQKEEKLALGDVNGDGVVDALDISTLSLALLKDITLTSEQTIAADVTGDGYLTITDLCTLAQYVAKVIPEFPHSK